MTSSGALILLHSTAREHYPFFVSWSPYESEFSRPPSTTASESMRSTVVGHASRQRQEGSLFSLIKEHAAAVESLS